ncbi:unnamed protein product [Timema podura]|uniref:Uncharacterized protein n=1 Tax=Timema podura TaxID=61482 RepID=A0ABN7NJV1_TIMPD|nr:unnamed protein product [Timema podura]
MSRHVLYESESTSELVERAAMHLSRVASHAVRLSVTQEFPWFTLTRLGSNLDLPVFGSLVQHEISSLDHAAIEAIHEPDKVLPGM